MTDFEAIHAPGSMQVTASIWPTLVLAERDRPSWMPSPYAYAMHLMGKVPLPPPGKEVRRGKLFEGPAEQILEEDHGIRLREKQFHVKHPKLDGVSATLDGLAEDGRIVEIKVVDQRDYTERWTRHPPIYPRMQALCQLACMPEVEEAVVAALVVSWKEIKVETCRVERMPGLIKSLELRAAKFLELIRAGEAPAPDFSRSSALTLRKALGLTEKRTSLVDSADLMRFERWQQAKLDKQAAEKTEEACRNYFTVRMLGATQAYIGDRYRIDVKEVHKKEHVVKACSYPQFTLKELKND